jgi:hypothetical protein
MIDEGQRPPSDIRWMPVEKCDHTNERVCEFCDFDGYFARTYADCPWRGR